MKHNEGPSELRTVRLNRFLAMCGVASRRKGEEIIRAGRVRLNDAVVTDLATQVQLHRDRVFIDGKEIALVHDPIYLVLNKPKDTITTLHDERGRNTVSDLVRVKERVFPIGRLDRNTTGVLLFTNDGDFAHRLMHPRFGIPKAYAVTLNSAVSREHLVQLRKGVHLKEGMTSPAQASAIPGEKGKVVGIVIREGWNRQVRRMFEALGYTIAKLDRVAYGPVTKEGLARGAFRRLTHAEVRELNRIAGATDPE